jgi:hypothetical protein
MKKLLIACGFILTCTCALDAQILATTLDGDTVLLNSDGTWAYLDTSDFVDEVLPVNPEKFVKPSSAKENYKGISKGYQIWYREKEWSRIDPKNLNPLAEVAFKSTEMDAYVMLIYEAMEATTQTLADIAIIQARKTASDLTVLSKEIRSVNGKDMVALEMTGKIQSIDIYYYNYYYSGPEGSIQLLCFTTAKASDGLKPKMEDLLNGLVILKD